MGYKNLVIGPDEFENYGIKSHYDVDSMIDEIKYAVKQADTDDETIKTVKMSDVDADDLKGVGNLESVNKDAVETGRTVKGLIATVDKDRADDIIPFDTFKKSKDDLTEKGSSTVFFNHDTDTPIGIVRKTNVTKRGMFAEIFISKASDVDDIWTKVKEGIINSFSIRLRPKKVEIVRDEVTGTIDSFKILDMDLFEASLVGLPMNAKANIQQVIEKSFKAKAVQLNQAILTQSEDSMSDKEKTMTEVASKLIEGKIDDLQKSLAETTAKVAADAATAAVTEALKNFQPPAPKVEDDKVEDAPADKAKAADQDAKSDEPSEAKVMADAILKGIAGLVATKNEKVDEPTKKGVNQDTEDSDDEDGAPRKVLKSAEDADTIKYVRHILLNAPEEYKALSEREREIAKQVYFQYHAVAMKSGLVSIGSSK